MKIIRLAAIGLTVLVPLGRCCSQDTPALRHGIVFGTFSDLRYLDEPGDVLGSEITIIPQYHSSYAIFQCAEGAPTDPVFVPVQIKGNRVTFQIEKDHPCSGTYTGVISIRGMTLSVRDSASVGNGFLPRRKSYWAR